MTRLLVCVSLALALGCSGSEKSVVKPNGNGEPPSDAGAGSDGSADDPKLDPGAPLSDIECQKFIRHVLDLGIDEMRATKPENEVPTEAQVEEIYRSLVGDEAKMNRCKQQPRWAFECAVKATSTQEVAACESKQ